MNVDRAEDKPDELFDRLVFSELGQQMHLSTDLIIADLLNELSPESHSKIASHLAACRDCTEAYALAKKALASEPESDEESPEPKLPKTLDAETRRRVEFIAMLNAKKASLIDRMVKSFAPQTLEAMTFDQRDYLGVPVADPTLAGPLENHRRTDTVREIINFISLLQDLIMEQCKGMGQLRHTLPEYVDEAMASLQMIAHDEQTRNKVTRVLADVLFQESPQA